MSKMSKQGETKIVEKDSRLTKNDVLLQEFVGKLLSNMVLVEEECRKEADKCVYVRV